MTERTDRTELRTDERGVWAVRSSSATVCYLDLDRRMLLRARGAGSPALPFDGVWVRLVRITSQRGDVGVVRVGDRHEYLTDPGGAYSDYRWWVPRVCVAIERVAPADVPKASRA